MGQLGEGVEVGALETLRGRVGRGGAHATRTGYGRDGGDMSAALGAEIAVGGRHHTHEAFAVGADRGQLNAWI